MAPDTAFNTLETGKWEINDWPCTMSEQNRNPDHHSEDLAVHGSLFGDYINPLIKEARERQDKLLLQWFEGQRLDIADLGCGDGYHASLFAGPGGRYDAFEFAPEMAEMARERFAREQLNNARLHQLDLAEFEPESDLYDIVWCLYFTPGNFRDRFDDPSRYDDAYLDKNPVFVGIFARFYRALKANGRMFLCVYRDEQVTEDAQWDFYLKTNQHPITPRGSRFVLTAEGFWSARWTRASMLSNLEACGIEARQVIFHELNDIAWLVEVRK